MNDLKIYLPELYNDVLEIDAIITAENVVVGEVEGYMQKALNDQFVETATETGVVAFENILNIMPAPADTMTLRKQRILSRLSMLPPLTLEALDQHMENIVGAGNYEISLEPAAYSLTLRIKMAARTFFDEANVLLHHVAPANLVLDVSLIYNTYAVLSAFTYAQLAAYTYFGLREEEIV